MERTKTLLLLTVAAVFGALIALLIVRTAVVSPQQAKAVSKQIAPVIGETPKNLQEHFAGTISKAMPAVVLITAQKRIGVVSPYSNIYDMSPRKIDYMEVPSGQGSGFFIRENGYILTNWHVVRVQDSFWITTHDGGEFPAKVMGADPSTDLAILKVDSKERFPILEFADPQEVKIGHWTIAIGAPFSLSRTVTVGIVSNAGRNGVGMNQYENYIQTDASINPGNSGGPLLNIHGKVIGVNDFILSPSGGNIGLSFAVSSEIAKRVSDELIRTGSVKRPWLGVSLAPLDRDGRRKIGQKHGVLIAQVFRRSPAADILERGDVILSINGRNTDTPADVQGAVFGAKPDSRVTMKIWRNGTILTRKLQLREFSQGQSLQ